MKRLILLAAACGTLVACGSGSSKSIVLQSKAPGLRGTYFQVAGSAAAAPVVARMLEQNRRFAGDLVGAPAVHGRRVCERTAPLVTYPVTAPSLRRLGGQTVSFALYGERHRGLTAALCQIYFFEFSVNGAIPLFGGNRTILRMLAPSMEPTLHCARADPGCLAHVSDFLVVRPSGPRALRRGAIVVFNATAEEDKHAGAVCESEDFGTVRRVIGLPGDTVREDGRGDIWIRPAGAATWTKLNERYLPAADRAADGANINAAYLGKQWHVPAREYFVMSDNHGVCDSRNWGSVPAANISGTVVDIIRGGKVLKPAGTSG